MFQREVAERIVATPGSKTYGRLSVLAAGACEAKILFDVAPSAFVPPPNVTSSLGAPRPAATAARLRPRGARTRDASRLRATPQNAAAESRNRSTPDALALIEAAGLEPTARAEDIPVEGFVALARALERGRKA